MRLFSTEQVSKYHPDKVADQVSDAILDACLAEDPNSHVAIETLVKADEIVLAGEITTAASVDYEAIARGVYKDLGYEAKHVKQIVTTQSPEIARGVGGGKQQGAGDQGMMSGFACTDTGRMLPFGFWLANHIIMILDGFKEDLPKCPLLGDAKCQVTVDLDAPADMRSVRKILVSACHRADLCDGDPKKAVEFVRGYIRDMIIGACGIAERTEIQIIVNPAGPWTLGGPAADCGLTGRKIVCDQYGGYAPVGGGAFSGKDPSKVDRSGAYMARRIACDLLRADSSLGAVDVQLAYAIGVAEPVSVNVRTRRRKFDKELAEMVAASYDLTPSGIIKHLDLLHRKYREIAGGCHYFKGDWING